MRRRGRRDEFDVLLVCTGNQCRSTIMEAVLRVERPDLRIRSAGTGVPPGAVWHPLAVEALVRSGYPATEGTPSRPLTRSDVQSARLILTAEGSHRSTAVRLDPRAEDKAFTLLEAARLAPPDAPRRDVDALRDALREALYAQRTEHDDDLADPLLGELADFLACLTTVTTALGTLFGSRRAQAAAE